jgi:hypothetical protein
MRVVVQFHSQVQDELERWLAGDDEGPERRALVRVYVDELVNRLRESRGKGPGAVLINRADPRLYRWQYTGEVELVYEVRLEGQGFFRPDLLRIIVTQIRLRSAE